ncbi:MAG: hypothetical protein ACRD2X_26370, partial [Vicinamibacteraceae bacterium]
PDADFVIAAAALSPWPNKSYEDIRLILNRYKERGYAIAFNENGWTLLRRTQPVRVRGLPGEKRDDT